MSLRALRFAFVFAMGLPAHLPAQALARPRPARPSASRVRQNPRARPQGDPMQKWANSGYHYCDAKVLGALWRTDPYGAKKRVGRKLLAGNYRGVQKDLARARLQATRRPGLACDYHEAGYSYRDAEKLARYWRVPVGEAKTMIARKVLAGHDRLLRKTLARTRPASPGAAAGTPTRRFPLRSVTTARKAFFGAGHGYCDAKLLGQMWRTSPWQAKSMGGYMLLGGGQKTLTGTLHMSRKLAARTRKGACTFAEAGFTPRDAQKLARLWRTNPKAARTRAEQKILWGGQRLVRSLLR